MTTAERNTKIGRPRGRKLPHQHKVCLSSATNGWLAAEANRRGCTEAAVIREALLAMQAASRRPNTELHRLADEARAAEGGDK